MAQTQSKPSLFLYAGSLEDFNLIIVNIKDRKSKSAIDMERNFIKASKSVDAKHYSIAISISTILADPPVCVRHGAACGVSARYPYFPVAELRRKWLPGEKK